MSQSGGVNYYIQKPPFKGIPSGRGGLGKGKKYKIKGANAQRKVRASDSKTAKEGSF